MGIGLVGVLVCGLLPALLAGLLIYQVVIFGARRLADVGVIPETGKIILLVFVSLVVVGVLIAVGMMIGNQINNGPESIDVLFQELSKQGFTIEELITSPSKETIITQLET